MAIVYIGLGSNLGDREEQVLRAVHEMRAFSHIRKISSLSETDPVGDTSQPKFINAVAEIETDYAPMELMEELITIEEELGRVRSTKGAAREIDLDIVAYEQKIVDEENLKIPHPLMAERRFVLEPMAEVAPDWVHPVVGSTPKQMLEKLG